MVPALRNLDDARQLVAERFPRLSDKQIAFCIAYVANGGRKRDAAISAGYAKASAHVEAYRQLQNQSVISAVHALSVMQLGVHLPGAIRTIGSLSTDGKSEYVRLQAAESVLDRLGLGRQQKVEHSGSVSVSFDFS